MRLKLSTMLRPVSVLFNDIKRTPAKRKIATKDSLKIFTSLLFKKEYRNPITITNLIKSDLLEDRNTIAVIEIQTERRMIEPLRPKLKLVNFKYISNVTKEEIIKKVLKSSYKAIIRILQRRHKPINQGSNFLVPRPNLSVEGLNSKELSVLKCLKTYTPSK